MEHRLTTLAIELGYLLAEEPVDVWVAAIHIGATPGHERLEPGRRTAERGARAQNEVLERLLDLSLVVRRPLERPKPHANAGGLKIVDHGFGDARVHGVASEVPGVESVGISRIREELLGAGQIVGDGRRLPEELEVRRDHAVGHSRKPERFGLIDRLAVDRVVCREPYPAVMPRRLWVPLVDEVDPVGIVRERRLEREPRRSPELLAE